MTKGKAMKQTIILKGIDADASLRNQISETIDHSLDHAKVNVDFVTVRVSDINGPRGGSDKHCQIHLKLFGLPNIVISETSNSVGKSITRAAQKIERVAKRALKQANNVHSINVPVLRRIAA